VAQRVLSILFAAVFLAGGCASTNGVYGAVDGSSQLFLQDEANDEDFGFGLLLVTDATVSCADFSDAVEDDFEGDGDSELLDMLLDTTSMFGIMGYDAQEDGADSLSDAWTGVFTGGGSYEGQGDDQIMRYALSLWFEPDGTYADDSSGLVITVSDFSGGALTGELWHPWDDFDFTTEDCGDEELL